MTSRSWVASFTCMLQIFTIWKTYYQQTKQHVHIISRIISSRLLSVRRVLQKHKAGTQRRHEMLEFPVFAVLHLWCTHLINYFLDLACFMSRRRLSCWDYCVTVSFFFQCLPLRKNTIRTEWSSWCARSRVLLTPCELWQAPFMDQSPITE